jgi:hypothetical protein
MCATATATALLFGIVKDGPWVLQDVVGCAFCLAVAPCELANHAPAIVQRGTAWDDLVQGKACLCLSL